MLLAILILLILNIAITSACLVMAISSAGWSFRTNQQLTGIQTQYERVVLAEVGPEEMTN